MGRILVCLFAVLIAIPLCAACARARAVRPDASPVVKRACCAAGEPAAPKPAPAEKRCVRCAPSTAALALDAIAPAVLLMPIPCGERVTIVVDSVPGRFETVLIAFHPPPPTPLLLHVMLTC